MICTRGIVAVGLCAPVGLAGPINPPAGPVSPTMKTLDQVEPRVSINDLPGDAGAVHIITEPGSYYLTGNVQGEPGKHCVVVDLASATTDDPSVSIDFKGFTIVGGPGSLDGIHCVATPGDPVGGINVSVEQLVGGGITDTGGDGIHCENVLDVNISGLAITDTGGDAIEIDNSALAGTPLTSGRKSLCQWITAANIGGSGVRVVSTDSAEILNCTIADTGGEGVNVTESEFVNLIDSYIQRTDDGIVIDDAETVTFDGVAVLDAGGDACRVTNVSSFGIKEEGVGITAPTGNGLVVEDCDQFVCSGLTVVNAGGDACRVIRVSSFGVSEEGIKITAPTGDGLVVEDCPVADLSNVSVDGGTGGITLTRSAPGGYYYWRVGRCVVSGVSGSGISASDADSVLLESCSVSNCGGNGTTIAAVIEARVRGLQSSGNGGDGLLVTAVGGAVPSLHCSDSTFTGNGAYGVRNSICNGTNFKECIIELNGTGGSGGGIWADDVGALTLSDSVINNNVGDGLLVTGSGGVATRFACRSNTVDGNTGRGIAIDVGSGTIVSHEMGHNFDFGINIGSGVVATIAETS